MAAPAVVDFSRLFQGIPRGAWVAISHDEEAVVAYAADLRDAVRKAKEAGEDDPRVIRVPDAPAALVL